MRSLEIPKLSQYPDLNFIPAYISALTSAQYVLAKHPIIAIQLVSLLASIFTYCAEGSTQSGTHQTANIGLWTVSIWAMVPICIIFAISTGGILKTLKADKLYATLILSAFGIVFGAGKVFDLDAEVVVFALLPFSFISALGLVRIGQVCGVTVDCSEGRLPEKV